MSALPIINRFLKLQKEVLDPLEPGLTFEGLVDALLVLYEHCNDKNVKTKHQAVGDFVNKFQSTIAKYHKLRISIKDFDVKRIIGRGNFADVKLVKEKHSGKVYAMKIMKKLGGNNSAFYEEERDIMARTTSPWLTRLDYAFQDSKNLYLAMEFHAGGDMLALQDRLSHPMDEKMIRFYIAEIALGIHDLHEMGFVHRDIKPENILLDVTGHVKIADFGSAGRLNTSGMVTKVIPVGTPDYIAPEVLQSLQNKKGFESHGCECDYWSLGVLAYELVYGTTPFTDANGSVVGTYSNIMSHQRVEFPGEPHCSTQLKDLIRKLLKPAGERIKHKQIVRHPFFSDIDWSNMRNHVPPHVPQVKGADDDSNFDQIEEEKSAAQASSLADKEYQNLPFIGFTFTSDKGKMKSLGDSDASNLEVELKSKATELENYKLRVFQLEQQLFNQTRALESSQREFDTTEKLTQELAAAEEKITQLKTNVSSLERVLSIERQDRSTTEHKTLQVLQDVRKKWKAAEEEKLDKLRSELKEEQAKSEELESSLNTTKRELKSTNLELESVKGVKQQLKNKLKDYKQRLENVAAMEEKRSEILTRAMAKEENCWDLKHTIAKLEAENIKLKETIAENNSVLNQSKQIEGKVDALQLVIEQRDQLLAERDGEIKSGKSKLETYQKKHEHDKAAIADLEKKNKTAKGEIANLQKEVEELKSQQLEKEEAGATAIQMKEELTIAITEISTLRKAKDDHRTQEDSYKKEIKKLSQEAEKRETEHKKAVNKLKAETEAKEEEYKEKIKGLEVLFEKLQGRINELQSKRKEEIKEKSRQELVEMEATIHKLETELEKVRGEEVELKAQIKKAKAEHSAQVEETNKLTAKIKEIEVEKSQLESTINTEKEKEEKSSDLIKKNMVLEQEIRELKLDLRIEKKEVERKGNLVTFVREREQKNKEKITEMESKIAELEKEVSEMKTEKERFVGQKEEIEKVREQLDKQRETLEKVRNEKSELVMESRKLKTETSGLESKISKLEAEIKSFDSEKERFKSIQLNNDTMKDLCVELDRQVTEFENANEMLEDKMTEMETENRNLVSKLDAAQEELRKAKVTTNEEKSAKLFIERKLRDVERKNEEIETELAKEKEIYEKNLGEYKELCKKLSDVSEELTGKNLRMEQTGSQSEKIRAHLTLENEKLKVELSEKTTQLASHKESNFKLTQTVEEAIHKIEKKNKIIDDLQLKMEGDARSMSEQITRLEGTISQQAKLIDFLQQKVGELEGRKKTLAEKMFGNKENRPDNHMVVGYKDVQRQLQNEKVKNRKLSDQLSKVRAEVVALKTNSVQQVDLPSGVLDKIDENKTATHNIPHRLSQGANKKTSKCPVCQDLIGFMMLAQICRDCGVVVHHGCINSLPPTCGLSSKLVSALQDHSALPVGRSYSESRSRANSDSKSMKDRPLPIPPSPDKEGPVQILLHGEWTEAVLVLTEDNILDIYEDSTRNIRIDQISLTAPHCRVSIQSSVTYSEIYYVNATDRPYTFKLTVHTSGKPEKAVYLMCQNFSQKVEWINWLDEVIKSAPSNMTPVPQGSQEGAKELIVAMPLNSEILALDFIDNIAVVGTVKGLYIRDTDSEGGDVRYVDGIEAPVHSIQYIKSIKRVLIATGSDGSTCDQLMTVCARAVAVGSKLHPEPVSGVSQCHVFAAHQNNKGNVFLCAANKHMVSIHEWSNSKSEFVIRHKFSTDRHTSCMLFTQTFVIVGTSKFYAIELKNFSAEEFVDICDPGISRTMNSPDFAGSEPRQVMKLKHTKEPEYILCYTRHLLFVDEYGQETRAPISFSKLPLEHRLIGSVLCTSFSERIQVLALDPTNTDKNLHKVSIYCHTPHLVSGLKNRLYYTTSGDAAYHLVALDLDKIKIESE